MIVLKQHIFSTQESSRTLQVADGYERQGLGFLVCKALTKIVGEMGDDASACVVTDNEIAFRLFRKIGYEVVDKHHFVAIAAKKS